MSKKNENKKVSLDEVVEDEFNLSKKPALNDSKKSESKDPTPKSDRINLNEVL